MIHRFRSKNIRFCASGEILGQTHNWILTYDMAFENVKLEYRDVKCYSFEAMFDDENDFAVMILQLKIIDEYGYSRIVYETMKQISSLEFENIKNEYAQFNRPYV